MTVAHEPERPNRLHRAKALTDEEFARAKKRLLEPHRHNPATIGPDCSLGRAANRCVTFNIVMAIIGIAIFLCSE
jgi:uncharacterized membrane protein